MHDGLHKLDYIDIYVYYSVKSGTLTICNQHILYQHEKPKILFIKNSFTIYRQSSMPYSVQLTLHSL